MKILTIKAIAISLLVCALSTPSFALTEAEFAQAIASSSGMSEQEAKKSMKHVFEALALQLEDGKEVSVRNFGRFYLQHRDARAGRNPKTGAEIQIPAKSYPRFASAKKLKQRVNK